MTYIKNSSKMAEAKSYSEENGVYYFKEIVAVLTTCINIDEFDIIPSNKPENKSCPFVLRENKLGIFSWCVKELFCYSYGRLMAERRKCLIGAHLMDLSRVVLLLHSEDYTVWNLRKRSITGQIKKYAKAELDFCALVLKKHPRSSETFSHRRWLINLLKNEKEQLLETREFQQDELQLTLLCAERYRDNYVTWDQRCWLVENFMYHKTWLEEELNSIKEWLWSHVSDNCVYHCRQHLLKSLATSCSLTTIKELLLKEFKLTDEILEHYPIFETVWYHRRFLISFWSTKFHPCISCLNMTWQNKDDQKEETLDRFELLKDWSKEEEINAEHCSKPCGHSEKSEVIFIANEMKVCQRTILANNDKSSELLRQSNLAKSHLKWMRYFCKKLLRETSKYT